MFDLSSTFSYPWLRLIHDIQTFEESLILWDRVTTYFARATDYPNLSQYGSLVLERQSRQWGFGHLFWAKNKYQGRSNLETNKIWKLWHLALLLKKAPTRKKHEVDGQKFLKESKRLQFSLKWSGHSFVFHLSKVKFSRSIHLFRTSSAITY